MDAAPWMGRGVACALLTLVGCGGASGVAPNSADGPSQLSLTVTIEEPALSSLVVTSGELELEHVGLLSDAGPDGPGQMSIPRVTFQLGTAAQTLVFAMAAPGLYSRLDARVDHIALVATWRGVPLQVHTNGNEQDADVLGTAQDLSATSSAHFDLAVDGTAWLDAALLDSVMSENGQIEIDTYSAPEVVDQIVERVVSSFTLRGP